ncbi:hypothetical protein ACFWAD_29790 [Rhodococcus sp. NPDC059969]|uniref:hypothetical protein n=1 Tax=Rhodococcus sp. NPDC059969 TaxID=3347018 RepID=UPI00366EA026
MTIAAESFVGRVLAVISRRSPGFRPPLKTSGRLHAPDSPTTSPPAPDFPRPRETPQVDPARDDLPMQRLVDATAQWKSMPPRERLRRRGVLLGVSEFLEMTAAALDRTPAHAQYRYRARDLGLALDRALHHARDPDLARDYIPPVGLVRDLNLELARAREHAHDLEVAQDLERVPALARDLVRAFDRARELADALDRALYRTRALNREGGLALNRERAGNLVLEIGRGLETARGLDRERAGNLVRDLAREIEGARSSQVRLSRILNPGRDRYRILALALDPTFGRYLTEAHDNLTDAASNFVGADLTTVDPARTNLEGIRWDGDTRWPTPEWTARIRRASVEDAPGSGVFIVLPEEGHNFADRGSVAPIF